MKILISILNKNKYKIKKIVDFDRIGFLIKRKRYGEKNISESIKNLNSCQKILKGYWDTKRFELKEIKKYR